jgi:glycosyltransferase involved in cell wall biosynthesis
MLRQADVLTAPDADVTMRLFEQIVTDAVEIAVSASEESAAVTALGGLVKTAGAWRRRPRALRVLVVGPTNSPHVEDYALDLRRLGVDVVVAGLPWSGGLQPSVLPGQGVWVSSARWPAVLWMRRLIKETRPTVVHAHWLPYAVTARMAGARPLVATAWGSDVLMASGSRRRSYRWALPRTDAVLADSHDVLSHLQHLGAAPARSRLMSWGVDLATFSPAARSKEELRRSLGLGAGPVMLSVRGFKPIYNPRLVIEVFERLARWHADLQLVLKHNSVQTPELPKLRFPERVHVVGPQPRELLAQWFAAADVCLSLASSDSSPRSVWEAMACGCPCVVSDLPWAREELEPGRHALVAPLDADAVADAVERVLTDRELARALAAEGRAHVQENHDRDNEISRVIELYEQLART